MRMVSSSNSWRRDSPCHHRRLRHCRHRWRRGSNSLKPATPHGDWEVDPLIFKMVTSSKAGYSAARRMSTSTAAAAAAAVAAAAAATARQEVQQRQQLKAPPPPQTSPLPSLHGHSRGRPRTRSSRNANSCRHHNKSRSLSVTPPWR